MRLIDADEVKKRFKPKEKYRCFKTDVDGLFNILDDAPTVELKHKGSWHIQEIVDMSNPTDTFKVIICSECHIARREQEYDIKYMNFCPHCGADMRSYREMTVEDGKIVKATASALFNHWLRTMSEFMDYETFKRRCIELGTEVEEDE